MMIVQAWKGRSQSPKEPSKIEEMAEEEAAEAEADAAPEAQPPKKRKRASKCKHEDCFARLPQ